MKFHLCSKFTLITCYCPRIMSLISNECTTINAFTITQQNVQQNKRLFTKLSTRTPKIVIKYSLQNCSRQSCKVWPPFQSISSPQTEVRHRIRWETDIANSPTPTNSALSDLQISLGKAMIYYLSWLSSSRHLQATTWSRRMIATVGLRLCPKIRASTSDNLPTAADWFPLIDGSPDVSSAALPHAKWSACTPRVNVPSEAKLVFVSMIIIVVLSMGPSITLATISIAGSPVELERSDILSLQELI